MRGGLLLSRWWAGCYALGAMSELEPGHLQGVSRTGRDPVIEAYKRHIDRTLLRDNLRLTPEQRVLRLMAFLRFTAELKRAGRQIS